MNITADEAHKPHESELRQWLVAVQTDAHKAFAHMPQAIHSLLVDLRWVEGYGLTPTGQEQIMVH